MRAALLTRSKARPRVPLIPSGIAIHSTATPGADARAIRAYMERETSPPASYHVVCDWKESLVLVPCWPGACEVAYHAGRTANSAYLAVSACESRLDERNRETLHRLVKVTRLLCLVWEMDPATSLVSHRDLSLRTGETDHVDPIPWLRKLGLEWPQFVSAVVSGRF